MIAAQDAERHRLERNLHDGAQQEVVALKVKLGLAKTIAGREGAEDIATMVDTLADTTQGAVDAMRAVAHGIYPPLLEAEGLAVALTAVARTSPVPLTIETDDVGRHERRVEETVYFCVLEAIDTAHMAGARNVRVAVTDEAGKVELAIEHDAGGTADLTVVTDRIDAIGGTLSAHERAPGTTHSVTGRIPTAEPTAAPDEPHTPDRHSTLTSIRWIRMSEAAYAGPRPRSSRACSWLPSASPPSPPSSGWASARAGILPRPPRTPRSWS